ncbi:MAG: GFA family protein [Geminicoccaceae bacterium]
MTTSQDLLTGGCQCGAVRYELSAAPRDVYICHCTECRRQSSSAFGISVIASMRLIKGSPKRWSRSTESGGTLDCFFCPACGSRLWHQDRGSNDVVSVKGGSLDRPVDLSTVPHIWTRSKLPGIVIPDHAQQFSEEPE